MTEAFFTQVEASQKLGRKVRSASNLPSAPEGTEGIVVKVIRSRTDDWCLRVRWQVPRTISFIDAAELSFFKREKPALSDLSKSEYDKSVEEIGDKEAGTSPAPAPDAAWNWPSVSGAGEPRSVWGRYSRK